MNHKETAEFYSWALDYRLVKVEEIIRWADNVILEDPAPNIAFINLSLSAGKTAYRVADALSEIPGEADKGVVFRKKISSLYEFGCVNEENVARIPHLLVLLAIDDEMADENFKSCAHQFEDAFEYILEDKAELTKDLMEFLRRYSS